MFTGLIEETGRVLSLSRQGDAARLKIGAKLVLEDLETGGSIAVSGVCLTAVEIGEGFFAADLSPETLERSSLGELHEGAAVNLERPLTPSSRIGGHFVQGHTDGVGELVSLEPAGEENWRLRVRVPKELLRYLVYKGSIAIDGVSLTVAALEGDVIGVAIIPHTYEMTSLRDLRSGQKVNLECDMIAKHVERLLSHMDLQGGGVPRIEDLKEQGF